MVDILKSYPWYIPAHIAQWKACGGNGVGAITELIVMNHPEAIVEPEEVDMDFLMSFAREEQSELRPRPVAMDAISSLEMLVRPQPMGEKRTPSMDLIDKFLEMKDLRIVALRDEVDESSDVVWEMTDPEAPSTFEDDLASEELARIYHNQGLYREASDIYNRLFLLYSEKSVYFATQIENVDKILEKIEKNN